MQLFQVFRRKRIALMHATSSVFLGKKNAMDEKKARSPREFQQPAGEFSQSLLVRDPSAFRMSLLVWKPPAPSAIDSAGNGHLTGCSGEPAAVELNVRTIIMHSLRYYD